MLITLFLVGSLAVDTSETGAMLAAARYAVERLGLESFAVDQSYRMDGDSMEHESARINAVAEALGVDAVRRQDHVICFPLGSRQNRTFSCDLYGIDALLSIARPAHLAPGSAHVAVTAIQKSSAGFYVRYVKLLLRSRDGDWQVARIVEQGMS